MVSDILLASHFVEGHMKVKANQIHRVQMALNVDYATALQLLRETNSVEEAIEYGRRMLGR